MEANRLIALSDGSTMGNTLFVFETNAPEDRLKKLEKQCNQIYADGCGEEIPIWSLVLEKEGYVFDYVDERTHVTAFGGSGDWLEDKYPQITECYYIENQPN